MGHDEAQARQAALVKFVRLIKASANDVVSEVEAISFTGDIASLTNYELTVVISQLQAQLCSNLNPHRTAPEPTPEPAPEPEPATREQRRAARQAQLEQQILNSADGWTSNGKNEKIDLFFIFQEVGLDSDALHDALKCYSNCELARCAYKNKLDGWNEWDKNQLVEALVQFVKNQRESWGTPATPAVSVVEEPAAMNLLESFEYASNQVQNLRERMEQGDRKLYRSVGEFMDSTDSTIQNLAAEALKDEPALAPEPAPEANRLRLFILFEEVGLDSDALHEALKHYTKPALVRVARQYKLAGKTALDKFKTSQLIEELVKYAVREVNRGSCFLKDDAPEPGLSWLDNPEAFTL